MLKATSVDEYILQSSWQRELDFLRQLILKTELKEEIKWGAPCYTWHGKNVVGLASFKSYVGLWFHQGIFLDDPTGILVSAGEQTRGLRQIRFHNFEEIDPSTIERFVSQAIDHARAGKKIPVEKKRLALPEELEQAFLADAQFKDAFFKLTPGRQREYAEFIDSAKQDATRIGRLRKSMLKISEGVGLNDKYRS